MAYEQPLFLDGLHRAAADLSGLQYRFVFLNSSGLIAQQVTAGADVFGVLQNKPLLGAPATVMQLGKSKVEAGAAIAQGAKVMCDVTGRAVTATATNKAVGIAELAAAAAGEKITVFLTNLGTQ